MPDIVIIDPLLSYIGGDVSRQDICSIFLRNQLNPILHEFKSGIIIIHHTNKPSEKYSSTSDLAYLGSGSSELTNWARAVTVVKQNKDDSNVYEIIHTKRGRRAGGNITTYLKHGEKEDDICWYECHKPKSVEKERTPRISKYEHLCLDEMPPLKHTRKYLSQSPMINFIQKRLSSCGMDSSIANAMRVFGAVRKLQNPSIVYDDASDTWHGISFKIALVEAVELISPIYTYGIWG